MLGGLTSTVFSCYPLGDMAQGTISRIAGDFHVEWPLLFAQTLNFCVVAFLLYRFAFRPLLSAVSERQHRIADGLQYAEEMKSQMIQAEVARSTKLREASQQAREMVEEAQRHASAFDQEQRALTAKKISQMELRAAQHLRQQEKAALESAQHAIREEVVQLTKKVLGRDLSVELRAAVALESAESLIRHEV